MAIIDTAPRLMVSSAGADGRKRRPLSKRACLVIVLSVNLVCWIGGATLYANVL